MLPIEERVSVLEKEVKELKYKLSPEARLESGKLAFSGVGTGPAPADGSLVPWDINVVPIVEIAQVERLAYVKGADGTEKWVAVRGEERWGGLWIADLIPWTQHDDEVYFKSCQKTHDPNTFNVGVWNKAPMGMIIERKGWNAKAPVNPKCHAEGWDIVPNVQNE